ncbi:MAG: prepilin-type N-terminal cleavage/methylation domain-containing protein [Campylobacterota bacterium]|nr:prepilin-type N-terminal cleavage/methylation domain-containing protein [Campylobacterota bacterium]
MKKAFSLLEVIFVIAIIGIIVTVAIPKLDENLAKANIIKIKNDITMVREGIIQYRDKMILQNNSSSIDTLDDDNELLFNKILTYPIIASKEKKINSWSKISDTTYKVFLDSQNSVEFIYDKINYTFDCDQDDEFCKELSQ